MSDYSTSHLLKNISALGDTHLDLDEPPIIDGLHYTDPDYDWIELEVRQEKEGLKKDMNGQRYPTSSPLPYEPRVLYTRDQDYDS